MTTPKTTLLSEFVSPKNRSVLELGCGTITQAPEVVACGGLYTGIDIKEEVVDRNQRSSSCGTFVSCPAERASEFLNEQSFSLVLSVFGALQFGVAAEILKEVRRVCSEGAQLLMSTRHPSLHQDDWLVDLGRAPQLRDYKVARDPEIQLRMNVSDRCGWTELLESNGWRLELYRELPGLLGMDCSVYVARMQ